MNFCLPTWLWPLYLHILQPEQCSVFLQGDVCNAGKSEKQTNTVVQINEDIISGYVEVQGKRMQVGDA